MNKASFDDLIRLLKLTGGKYIFIEDGEPRAVLMDYHEFEELAVPHYAGKLAREFQETERVNREITKAQLADLREEVIADIADLEANIEEEIRIEPLDPVRGDVGKVDL